MNERTVRVVLLTEFEGKRCEKSKRACTDTTCSAGLCVDSIDGFHCECNIGKEGPTCSKGSSAYVAFHAGTINFDDELFC